LENGAVNFELFPAQIWAIALMRAPDALRQSVTEAPAIAAVRARSGRGARRRHNPARRHSGIRYLTPIAYEMQILKETEKRPKDRRRRIRPGRRLRRHGSCKFVDF
jgi:hypothetical protein